MRNREDFILLIYEFLDREITTSSLGIVSFGLNSQIAHSFTRVFLSSQNLSLISSSSVQIIVSILSGFARISFRSAISSNFSVNSSSIFCLSSPDNLCNCISRIA